MCVHVLECLCWGCLQYFFLSMEKFPGGHGAFTRLQSCQIPSCFPPSLPTRRQFCEKEECLLLTQGDSLCQPVANPREGGRQINRQTDRPTYMK